MDPTKKIQDLFLANPPVAITGADVISIYGIDNVYALSSSKAAIVVLPNASESEGCSFAFIPGTCTGGVTIKDDAGNTIASVATDDNPFILKSTGKSFLRLDKDTDTHA